MVKNGRVWLHNCKCFGPLTQEFLYLLDINISGTNILISTIGAMNGREILKINLVSCNFHCQLNFKKEWRFFWGNTKNGDKITNENK